jgi:hypothetical protein
MVAVAGYQDLFSDGVFQKIIQKCGVSRFWNSKRFRAKWNPVRVKKTHQIKNLMSFSFSWKR